MESNKAQLAIDLLKRYWNQSNELFHQAYHNHASENAAPALQKVSFFKDIGLSYLKLMCIDHGIFDSEVEVLIHKLDTECGFKAIPFDFILGYSIFYDIKAS